MSPRLQPSSGLPAPRLNPPRPVARSRPAPRRPAPPGVPPADPRVQAPPTPGQTPPLPPARRATGFAAPRKQRPRCDLGKGVWVCGLGDPVRVIAGGATSGRGCSHHGGETSGRGFGSREGVRPRGGVGHRGGGDLGEGLPVTAGGVRPPGRAGPRGCAAGGGARDLPSFASSGAEPSGSENRARGEQTWARGGKPAANGSLASLDVSKVPACPAAQATPALVLRGSPGAAAPARAGRTPAGGSAPGRRPRAAQTWSFRRLFPSRGCAGPALHAEPGRAL